MSFPKPKDSSELSPLKAIGSDRSSLDAFLGQASKVTGTLTFDGAVELDGQVEGEIIAKDRLYIGESAVCNAKITGTDVLVKGTVNGDIAASSRLTLKKPARVTGNIATANLTIEEGVFFEGKCIMCSGSSLGSDRKTETTK